MATALDVISLEEAKALLKVDFADEDAYITGLIHTAVAIVERRTDHYLYQREVTIDARQSHEVYAYPFEIVSATDKDLTALNYTAHPYSLMTRICINGYYGHYLLKLKVGYLNKADIPAPLLTAAERLITYLFSHRDVQPVEMPSDVQMMLQPYRRYASI